MTLIALAKYLKHGGHVAAKKTRPLRMRARGLAWQSRSYIRPYTYDVGRYLDHRGFPAFDFFLHRHAPFGWVDPRAETERRLWVVWSQENPLTPNRERSLEGLRRVNRGLEVTLVTPSNLREFVVDSHPLHDAYRYLSAVHRSDYLRAYLLHHHGGAYADIKPMRCSLQDALEAVSDPDGPMVVGYPEVDSDLVDNLYGPVGNDVRRNHHRILGIGAMAARARTVFTAEWLAEVERRMSYYKADLRASPAGDPYGSNPGYPVTWIGLGADVFQPLQLKYLGQVHADPAITPGMSDYR